jgi:hypothetical protein
MITEDLWFNLHEDRNFDHKFVLTSKKPDTFFSFSFYELDGEPIDTLHAWLQSNDLLDFYKPLKSMGFH